MMVPQRIGSAWKSLIRIGEPLSLANGLPAAPAKQRIYERLDRDITLFRELHEWIRMARSPRVAAGLPSNFELVEEAPAKEALQLVIYEQSPFFSNVFCLVSGKSFPDHLEKSPGYMSSLNAFMTYLPFRL
jgi:hypothetical protein